ncbi:tRNA1(Val) (adenine(37)-N6)-methyltransferase [Dysgonomonas sp. 511]|uniref:tRNA1(Val) (adenine(37)-N6)-methyltransferase n=1 Tax=Dysgonomonas sp. 511 TaxID=2302930 RepID=UPI0013D28E8C|nr:methyltransferase [Dysgonomonas sp. 511]NDV79567.1 methyltransferase domain-containing protein [Dysgonomonas sp. 511]
MPNPYFRFKQFTVYHDRCAMKVGTDGVLLGAWADISQSHKVLDIGTGTGLISLMVAQRNPLLSIEAIDMDMDAVEQARDNIGNSPFGDRIRCYNCSLQQYYRETSLLFDHIICNPPFFSQSLKSPDKKRSIARHTDSLTAEDLISISSKMLTEAGKISIIYPFAYKEQLVLLAKNNGLCISRMMSVRPTATSDYKRIVIEMSKVVLPISETDMIIEKERHKYSDEFIGLVKDFYLKL